MSLSKVSCVVPWVGFAPDSSGGKLFSLPPSSGKLVCAGWWRPAPVGLGSNTHTLRQHDGGKRPDLGRRTTHCSLLEDGLVLRIDNRIDNPTVRAGGQGGGGRNADLILTLEGGGFFGLGSGRRSLGDSGRRSLGGGATAAGVVWAAGRQRPARSLGGGGDSGRRSLGGGGDSGRRSLGGSGSPQPPTSRWNLLRSPC